jgi:hypothetical protein
MQQPVTPDSNGRTTDIGGLASKSTGKPLNAVNPRQNEALWRF